MSILIDESTTILVQGITGREGRIITKDSLDYGTKIVAGVTPGKGGQKVQCVPVYDCLHSALSNHKVDACLLCVPPLSARDAAFEAIENKVRLILIVTERIPRRDVAEILSLASKNNLRVIGPNSLGVITPEKSKLGTVGGSFENTQRTFKRGNIGIISRSGGMTAELASLLTSSGIGQSTCACIGGDPFVGSTFKDLFMLFEKDDETKAVVVFCEPGGGMEEELAEYYRGTNGRLPIVAFIAGRFVDLMPGTRFGHAGVIVENGRGTTRSKIEAFKSAGIQVVDRLRDLVPMLRNALTTNYA